MSETTMPAVEAIGASDERNSYEFAFHILPTIAEGEVTTVFNTIRDHIRAAGSIFDEEAPERTDLVYPIVKSFEGKNRKFTSAYFGWVRFKLDGDKVTELSEELDHVQQILRSLLIKLTALEETHPFRFHENRKSLKMHTVVHEDAELEGAPTETEEDVEVSEEALDESLEKITKDDIVEEKAG